MNAAYPFPSDDTEWIRLDKKHSAGKVVFDGLSPCPDVVDAVLKSGGNETKRILDAGCGTGTWALEMANLYPEADVCGMDLAPVPLDETLFPPNLRFEIDDLNQDLSHSYGMYDIIQARSVMSGITDIVHTYRELQLCLRPGGLLLIIEGDREFWDQDKKKVMMAKVEGDEDVSGISEDGSWFQRIMWEAIEASIMAGSNHVPAFQYIDEGLWGEPLLDPETAMAGSAYAPIGPWAKGSNPEETHLLEYMGILRRQDFSNGHRAFHPILLRHGLDQEMLNEWSKRADEELNTCKFRLWSRYRFTWARRRAGAGLPAPPLVNGSISQPIRRYPAIEFYTTQDEARLARKKRVETIGEWPTPLVVRAMQNPASH